MADPAQKAVEGIADNELSSSLKHVPRDELLNIRRLNLDTEPSALVSEQLHLVSLSDTHLSALRGSDQAGYNHDGTESNNLDPQFYSPGQYGQAWPDKSSTNDSIDVTSSSSSTTSSSASLETMRSMRRKASKAPSRHRRAKEGKSASQQGWSLDFPNSFSPEDRTSKWAKHGSFFSGRQESHAFTWNFDGTSQLPGKGFANASQTCTALVPVNSSSLDRFVQQDNGESYKIVRFLCITHGTSHCKFLVANQFNCRGVILMLNGCDQKGLHVSRAIGRHVMYQVRKALLKRPV